MADILPDVYLRFKGVPGECTDEFHPGDQGWVQIKTFNFGFGMTEGSWDAAPGDSANTGGGSGSSTGAGGSSVPLDFPEVSLTKVCDLATTRLLKEKCHEGGAIPELELVACRYGGNDNNNPKIPFLTLLFKQVHIKSVSLSLAQDELPSETITFKYDVVQMATIWTDNETGNRLTSDPKRCGWDNSVHKPAL